MSVKVYTDVDLKYNIIQNVGIQSVQPSNPKQGKAGTIYYDPNSNRVKYWDGSTWITVGADPGEPTGEFNVLEGININNTSLAIEGKTAKLNFSSTSPGNLTIKDMNTGGQLVSLNLGSGFDTSSLLGVGTLKKGYSRYIFSHAIKTNFLLVQVIDSNGNTVICDTSRYSSGDNYYVRIDFSSPTKESYKVIIAGNPQYSELGLIENE